MYDQLQQYIQNKVALPSAEWDFIRQRFHPQNIPAGTKVVSEGKVCPRLYFLSQGLLRYYHWIDGSDKTKFFTFENQLFTAQSSFSQQVPARENIQSLEDCKVLYTSFAESQELFQHTSCWPLFIREVILEVNVWTEELLIEGMHLTAAHRYQQLLHNKPEWIQRIPIKHLATFLGVAPESLSRIRRKLNLASQS